MPRLHHRIARRLGYSLIPQRKNHLELEPHLQHVLDLYAVDAVIDVGANEGQFGTGLRSGGFSGPIVSFEPGARAFAALERTVAGDAAWHVEQLALGAETHTRTLFVPEESVYASLLPLNDRGRAQLGEHSISSEDVSVRRLDEAVATILPLSAKRMLLKIDTQGFDLEVFAGASGLLDRVVALQVELAMRPLYDGVAEFHEALVEYEEAGFEVTGFFPITRDRQTLTVIEYDAVLVRPAARSTPEAASNGRARPEDAPSFDQG